MLHLYNLANGGGVLEESLCLPGVRSHAPRAQAKLAAVKAYKDHLQILMKTNISLSLPEDVRDASMDSAALSQTWVAVYEFLSNKVWVWRRDTGQVCTCVCVCVCVSSGVRMCLCVCVRMLGLRDNDKSLSAPCINVQS